MCGHLHNRVKGHKQQSPAMAKHYKNVHGMIPQDLLKRFEVLKKCRSKFDCLLYEMFFIRALKAKSQRTSRLYSCESIFIILAPCYVNFRATLLKVCNLHFNIFLDNGGMTTPKRRILSFIFTVLTLNK